MASSARRDEINGFTPLDHGATAIHGRHRSSAWDDDDHLVHDENEEAVAT
jgi:hypothetical protein